MAKRGRPRKRRQWARLIYNGIVLVPVDRRRVEYKDIPESWHLPGGEIVATKELVRRAEARGITLLKEECDGNRTRLLTLT